MEQRNIKDHLKQFIKDNARYFQLNAQFAHIQLSEPAVQYPKIVLGRYDAARHISYPFYRPYSKIIDIKVIE